MTELTCPTSVRTLTGADPDPGVLVAGMARHLPPSGLAEPRVEGMHFARATWRVLDSRILAAAVEILDLDVARPLVEWLAGFERLRTAAEATLTDADQPERTEILLPPHPVTVTDHLSVSVRIDGRQVAEIAFTLDVELKLGETSALVRSGAIEEVVAEVCAVTASLSLDAWPTPLWHPDPITVPVRLVVRPPIRIPLVPVPRAPDRDHTAARGAATVSPPGRRAPAGG